MFHRFRRDPDDGGERYSNPSHILFTLFTQHELELPARPAFRTTLSQPSQMGNFRHQSIRTTERDKDKDIDKERDRDMRDKEGAEKLRSVRQAEILLLDASQCLRTTQLSDKYDRDRLALSSTLRNKDRDSAPHLSAGSSAKLSQGQTTNGTRRAEGREPAKRKPGESEDWRRGTFSLHLELIRT